MSHKYCSNRSVGGITIFFSRTSNIKISMYFCSKIRHCKIINSGREKYELYKTFIYFWDKRSVQKNLTNL